MGVGSHRRGHAAVATGFEAIRNRSHDLNEKSVLFKNCYVSKKWFENARGSRCGGNFLCAYLIESLGVALSVENLKSSLGSFVAGRNNIDHDQPNPDFLIKRPQYPTLIIYPIACVLKELRERWRLTGRWKLASQRRFSMPLLQRSPRGMS